MTEQDRLTLIERMTFQAGFFDRCWVLSNQTEDNLASVMQDLDALGVKGVSIICHSEGVRLADGVLRSEVSPPAPGRRDVLQDAFEHARGKVRTPTPRGTPRR